MLVWETDKSPAEFFAALNKLTIPDSPDPIERRDALRAHDKLDTLTGLRYTETGFRLRRISTFGEDGYCRLHADVTQTESGTRVTAQMESMLGLHGYSQWRRRGIKMHNNLLLFPSLVLSIVVFLAFWGLIPYWLAAVLLVVFCVAALLHKRFAEGGDPERQDSDFLLEVVSRAADVGCQEE